MRRNKENVCSESVQQTCMGNLHGKLCMELAQSCMRTAEQTIRSCAGDLRRKPAQETCVGKLCGKAGRCILCGTSAQVSCTGNCVQ